MPVTRTADQLPFHRHQLTSKSSFANHRTDGSNTRAFGRALFMWCETGMIDTKIDW